MSAPYAETIATANRVLLVEGDGDAAERFFTPDYVAHVTETDRKGGPDGVRRYLDMLHKAFSDLEVSVDILAEAGDRVAWQRTLAAMHTGSYMGFPATDRHMVWRDMLVSRFSDGRIAEEWVVTDLAERLLVARKAKKG